MAWEGLRARISPERDSSIGRVSGTRNALSDRVLASEGVLLMLYPVPVAHLNNPAALITLSTMCEARIYTRTSIQTTHLITLLFNPTYILLRDTIA